MIYREQFACLCGFRSDQPDTCEKCREPLFSTADQQARTLNTMPSGKTGRWYPDTDGQGVVYRHGAVHTRPASPNPLLEGR